MGNRGSKKAPAAEEPELKHRRGDTRMDVRPAGGAEPSDNPVDTQDYAAPVMSEEDLRKITVPFSEISSRLRPTLDEHGTALVVGVLAEEELAALEADFALDLGDLVDEQALAEAGPKGEAARRAFQAFKEQGPRAFPVNAQAKVCAAAGFSVKRCLSHGRFAWRARRHPNVQAVYQAIYPEATGLVSSMDVTFFTPEGQAPTERNKFSAHVDQNSSDVRPGLADCESFQGVLYVWPAGADGKASTTVVWPGSHRSIWPEMMNDASFSASGSCGFHYSEIIEMSDRASARRLAAGWAKHARRAVVPAGGLFLWNSRTVHTGWRGGPRLAQTVCFEPAERRPEKERLAKLRLAALGLPSTHWASAGMQHDIILGDPGFAAEQPEEGRGRRHLKGLPLRPAIRPACLAEGADLAALRKLVEIEYRLTGMWDPPDDMAELLDASIGEDFRRFL